MVLSECPIGRFRNETIAQPLDASMKKNFFTFVLVILFIVALVGMWKINAVIDQMIEETGYIKCIPEKTRPALCEKFNFYKTVFLSGTVPMLILRIFRKRIIVD